MPVTTIIDRLQKFAADLVHLGLNDDELENAFDAIRGEIERKRRIEAYFADEPVGFRAG